MEVEPPHTGPMGTMTRNPQDYIPRCRELLSSQHIRPASRGSFFVRDFLSSEIEPVPPWGPDRGDDGGIRVHQRITVHEGGEGVSVATQQHRGRGGITDEPTPTV